MSCHNTTFTVGSLNCYSNNNLNFHRLFTKLSKDVCDNNIQDKFINQRDQTSRTRSMTIVLSEINMINDLIVFAFQPAIL